MYFITQQYMSYLLYAKKYSSKMNKAEIKIAPGKNNSEKHISQTILKLFFSNANSFNKS